MADNSVDDFFNKKKKKTSKKNKKTMQTAADLLKETEEPREIESQPKDQVNRESQVQEDEWLEQDSEQVFVIEGAGLKRLVTDEKTQVEKDQNSSDNEEGGEENREKGETSWKNADENQVPAATAQMPGQMPTRQPEIEQEENKTASEPQKSKYVPPSQRKVAPRMPEPSGPYRNRQKINIESNADFPTLGAAADQVAEGFDVVTTKAGGRSWGGGSMAASSVSTGVSNRFQGLENH